MARQGTGLNIAKYRSMAGRTQQQVAAVIGVTKNYISMIENGHRALTDIHHIHAIAEFLGVSFVDLTGQPYKPTTRSDYETHIVIPRLRAALDEGDEPVELLPMEQLAIAADRSMSARMACDVPAIGEHLPALLASTRVMWFEHGDRAAGDLLVKAAVTGALAIKSAGWVDLAHRLAELALSVATALGDPICVAAARFAVAQCALSVGSRGRSARIAAGGAEDLDRLTRGSLPRNMVEDVMAWMGLLHLHAALSVAGMERPDRPTAAAADGHLAEAEAAARRVTGDPWRMEFSAANVATWRVGVALENGHPERAPELARRVDLSQLRTRQRRSRLHLDTGRAQFVIGDTDGAVQSLLAADRAAPNDLRSRSAAVEITAQLVRDMSSHGDGSTALLELAKRVGVDPADPGEAS